MTTHPRNAAFLSARHIVIVFLFVLMMAGSFHARLWAQGQTIPGTDGPTLVRLMVARMEEPCAPILDRADVSDADKEKLRGLLKSVRDGAERLLADAGADRNPAELLGKLPPLQNELTQFLKTRPDLYWIMVRDGNLLVREVGMLSNKSADYLALIKGTGLNDAAYAQVKQLVEQLESDRAKLAAELKAVDAASTTQPLTHTQRMELILGRSAKERALAMTARDGIRPKLTADQRWELEWKILNFPTGGDTPALRILGFSTQLISVRAPQDGKYVLMAWTEPQPVALGEPVALKKGQPLGFRKTDKGVQPFAGDQALPVPAGSGPFFWQVEKQ